MKIVFSLKMKNIYKMKKLTLILLICGFASYAQAQFKLGIKAGVSTTNLEPNDLNLLDQNGAEDLELALKEAKFGVHAGLIFRGEIGKFIIMPEIIFNSNTVDFEVTDLDNPSTAGEVFSEKYQYVDIPFLFGYKLGPLRLMTGPEAHLFINSSSDLLDFDNYEQNFDNVTIAWLAGIGLDIWNLMIDVRYEGNFSNFGTHIDFAGNEYEFDESPSRILFSLGLTF